MFVHNFTNIYNSFNTNSIIIPIIFLIFLFPPVAFLLHLNNDELKSHIDRAGKVIYIKNS